MAVCSVETRTPVSQVTVTIVMNQLISQATKSLRVYALYIQTMSDKCAEHKSLPIL